MTGGSKRRKQGEPPRPRRLSEAESAAIFHRLKNNAYPREKSGIHSSSAHAGHKQRLDSGKRSNAVLANQTLGGGETEDGRSAKFSVNIGVA